MPALAEQSSPAVRRDIKTAEKYLPASFTAANSVQNNQPWNHNVIVFSFVPADMKLRIQLTQQPTADSSPRDLETCLVYDVKLCVEMIV